MNRDIKFRGWSIKDNKWVYGYLVNTNVLTYIIPKECYLEIEMVPVRPTSIGQYTGVIDKNNKEIYEGDIIQVSKEYGTSFVPQIVDFMDGIFILRNTNYMDDYNSIRESDFCFIHEVVDNFYENKQYYNIYKEFIKHAKSKM